MNNKGFTLVELLATIVILALVLSIGSFSIITIIKNAKEKNYNSLIDNIKDASELYYQECKYANNSGIACNSNGNITLGELVRYGYLKGNNQAEDNTYTIVNPMNNNDISNCVIAVNYDNGKVNVTAVNTSGGCPTEY